MNNSKSFFWYQFGKLIIFFLALLIIFGIYIIDLNRLPKVVSPNTWQAVFLTDGQVYFGKLEDENSKYATLRNVYYLKYGSSLQQEKIGQGATSQSNLNLIKLGGEAHGPQSEMFISKDKILFFENLKESSSIVQAIRNNPQ